MHDAATAYSEAPICSAVPPGPGARYVAHVALRERCCACWPARARARYLFCCFFLSPPPFPLLSKRSLLRTGLNQRKCCPIDVGFD